MRHFPILIPLVLIVSILTTTTCKKSATLDLRDTQPVQAPAAPATDCSLPIANTLFSDHARVIDQESKDELERQLRDLKNNGSIDFAVVVLDTTGGSSVADYSMALAKCWGVGGKNPDQAGLLLLVAVNDRKWHIQISRVLEKVLTNDEVFEIGNLMAPDFKQKRYAEGLKKCVDRMIETLAKRRGFAIHRE